MLRFLSLIRLFDVKTGSHLHKSWFQIGIGSWRWSITVSLDLAELDVTIAASVAWSFVFALSLTDSVHWASLHLKFDCLDQKIIGLILSLLEALAEGYMLWCLGVDRRDGLGGDLFALDWDKFRAVFPSSGFTSFTIILFGCVTPFSTLRRLALNYGHHDN